jgi:hypothetical protein
MDHDRAVLTAEKGEGERQGERAGLLDAGQDGRALRGGGSRSEGQDRVAVPSRSKAHALAVQIERVPSDQQIPLIPEEDDFPMPPVFRSSFLIVDGPPRGHVVPSGPEFTSLLKVH